MALTDMPPGVTSRKVAAATGGAGAGSVIALFLVGILDDHVYVAGDVPGYVSGLIFFAVPVALSWLAGYRARRGVDELVPPQRPGQHVRRRDEDGAARLPNPRDTAVLLALAFLVVCLGALMIGTVRSW